MNKEQIKSLQRFITVGIWRVTDDELTPLRKRLYNVVKIITLSITQFIDDRLSVRASALTYSTLFAIIPILALLFAVARGFGMGSLVESQLRSGFLSDQSELVFGWIDSYLQHAQSGVFIGVGIIVLLFAILMLIDNIERSFNHIWAVKRPRTMFRKITDYFSMILLMPVLIVVSAGLTIFMTAYVKTMEHYMLLGPMMKFGLRSLPYLLTCTMLTALLIFMPNTKVSLRHAILPGILVGSAFQAFQYIYVNSQIWMSNYNAIYGSFAAIPLFLFWAQVSWNITLFGAEMSYVSQNLESFSFGQETANISRRFHDFFCVVILSTICKQFVKGGQPLNAEQISSMHRIPIRLTKTLLYELCDIKLAYEAINEDKDDSPGYLPGIDPNHLSIGMLLGRLEANGAEDFKIDIDQYSASWEALVKVREEYLQGNEKILLKDL